jgi:hypothetical protein
MAVGAASSYLCDDGSLTSVELEGATTVEDLARLQPRTPGMDQMTVEFSSKTMIYGVVVGGKCSFGEDGRTATRGYVLFTSDGSVIFYRLWDEDATPDLTEPFGAQVEAAITS